MPANPLFSTYRGGENRVTSSMLAVFERVDSGILERLLVSASGESTLPFVSFTNQLSGPTSVPDAAISASFRYLFEVKTEFDALGRDQLDRHLESFDGSTAHERLFAVTPDADEPEVIEEIDDDRLTWLSFGDLDQAIEDVLADRTELISEQARFLLQELRSLFANDGLLGRDDTVIVAARRAYPEYLRSSAYVCQAGRSFRTGIRRMGFYANGAIQKEVPLIQEHRDNVVFSDKTVSLLRSSGDDSDRKIADLIESLAGDRRSGDGQPYQVFLLTRPDGDETTRLERPIQNTTRSQSGRPWAWTLGQRYVKLATLQAGFKTTTELDSASSRG